MLSTRSTAAAAALTTVLVGVGPALLATPTHAAPLTCQGKTVTITGDTGTDGDDVMVVGGPGRSGIVGTGAGNDTVCIRVTTDERPRSIYLSTGPGADQVVNESTESSVEVGTALGAGADTYIGNDLSESVITGAASWAGSGDTSDAEVDVVDTGGGDDYVTSGSVAPGAVNDDQIMTGDGDDQASWAGEQGRGWLDLGAGDNRLAFYPGWQGTSVLIDVATRTATADERTVLRWAGDVNGYRLSVDNLRTTFVGADAAETIYVTAASMVEPDQRLHIDMGGGDDRVDVWEFVPGSIVGGAGRDRLYAPQCIEAVARLGHSFHCKSLGPSEVEGDSSIDAWEYLHTTGGDITVIGTDGPEQIVAAGADVGVRARGGDDDVRVNGWNGTRRTWPVAVDGGAGSDRIRGGASRERLAGGPGRDDLFGGSGTDLLLGGGGNDRMRGGQDNDRLVGGPGRDRADGGKDRDRCSAEVRRSCER